MERETLKRQAPASQQAGAVMRVAFKRARRSFVAPSVIRVSPASLQTQQQQPLAGWAAGPAGAAVYGGLPATAGMGPGGAPARHLAVAAMAAEAALAAPVAHALASLDAGDYGDAAGDLCSSTTGGGLDGAAPMSSGGDSGPPSRDQEMSSREEEQRRCSGVPVSSAGAGAAGMELFPGSGALLSGSGGLRHSGSSPDVSALVDQRPLAAGAAEEEQEQAALPSSQAPEAAVAAAAAPARSPKRVRFAPGPLPASAPAAGPDGHPAGEGRVAEPVRRLPFALPRDLDLDHVDRDLTALLGPENAPSLARLRRRAELAALCQRQQQWQQAQQALQQQQAQQAQWQQQAQQQLQSAA